MKRPTFAFAWLAVTALTFAACGDDDNDNGGGNGTGTGGKSSVGNVECDPDAATTCQNETDCPYVADGSVRAKAQQCGQGECLASDDENCARDCILADLDMTPECASCYANVIACTIAECLGDCIADPNSAGCLDCQETSGCRPDFNECSGLEE